MMSPFVLNKAINDMTAIAYHYAPCGLKAVEAGVRQYCEEGRLDIKVTEVGKVAGTETVYVIVQHGPEENPELATFEVCNPPINFETWEETLAFIKARQKVAPQHLAGLPHNADEKLTGEMTDWLAKKTNLELQLGDIWVHVADGKELLQNEDTGKLSTTKRGEVCLGYVTWAGSVAMHRYQDQLRDKTA